MRASFLRRSIALILLAVLGAAQATSASCAMATSGAVPHGVAVEGVAATAVLADHAGASASDAHAHHAAAPADKTADTPPLDRRQGTDGCVLLMACGLAVPAPPAPAAAVLVAGHEATSGPVRVAYHSPTLAFEPPPPRALLI